MSKPWERGKHQGRTTYVRPRRRVLIVCEDQKSACLYFEAFPVDQERYEVHTEGTGMNTYGVVERAIVLKREAGRRDEPYSEVWCVFDRDEFPAQHFNRAFELARTNNINIAWSNEAFELWYLLHFSYCDTALHRSDYAGKLKPHLGRPYAKADPEIYGLLKTHQEAAIRNAQRLEQHWRDLGKYSPEGSNPCTSVHKLVALLNELAELGSINSPSRA